MSGEIDRSAEWRSQRNVSWMWCFLVTTVGLCRFTPPRSIMRRPIACSFVDMGKGMVVNGFVGMTKKVGGSSWEKRLSGPIEGGQAPL